jgi:RimJ/RimL family protein N-acetyltransferase
MSLRNRAAIAVNKALGRRGLAIVSSKDAAISRWVASNRLILPLPTRPLEDDKVRLRPVRLSDVPEIVAGAADPAVVHFAIWPSPFTEEHARQWIATSEVARHAGRYFALAVEDVETGRFAGLIGLSEIDHQSLSAEQFLWLVPEVRGKGLAIFATLMLDRYIFAATPIGRMLAVTLADNQKARVGLERMGYTEEGLLRGGIVHYGDRHDAVQYSMLRSDLEDDAPSGPGGREAAASSTA